MQSANDKKQRPKFNKTMKDEISQGKVNIASAISPNSGHDFSSTDKIMNNLYKKYLNLESFSNLNLKYM